MPADVAPLLLAVAASAVILGTVLQRVSGMGVGLVVSPTLALLLGPVAGVLLTNITTVVSAALIGITLRHDIDWQRYRRLAPLIVVGSIPGALLVGAADRNWLEVIIGVALLGTLLTTALVRIPPLSGRLPAAAAGTAGGFLNTAVGVAAPAMLVYAQATGWQQRSFAATLQPIFGTMGLVSVLAKVATGRRRCQRYRRACSSWWWRRCRSASSSAVWSRGGSPRQWGEQWRSSWSPSVRSACSGEGSGAWPGRSERLGSYPANSSQSCRRSSGSARTHGPRREEEQ